MAPQPKRVVPPPPAAPAKEQVRALYPFAGQEAGDLSFEVGDVITVLKKEGGWWEGELNGKTGAFPHNYVEQV